MPETPEASAAWSNHWRVRYPNGDVAPAMSREQAERVARNVGGEALPPVKEDTDGR